MVGFAFATCPTLFSFRYFRHAHKTLFSDEGEDARSQAQWCHDTVVPSRQQEGLGRACRCGHSFVFSQKYGADL